MQKATHTQVASPRFSPPANGYKTLDEHPDKPWPAMSPRGRGDGAGLLPDADDGGFAVCGRNGDIYVAGRGAGGWRIYILNAKGTELLTEIDSSGSKRGLPAHAVNIAVDQSNCHVFIADYERPVEEYEASGAFVAELGPPFPIGDVAVDNGAYSLNRGNVYITPYEGWHACGPLSYGKP